MVPIILRRAVEARLRRAAFGAKAVAWRATFLVLAIATAPSLQAQSAPGNPSRSGLEAVLHSLEAIGEVDEDGVRHVDVGQAEALLRAHPDIIVVDVRTSAEFRSGHLPNAQHLNYFWFSFRRRVQALDPDRVYLVHCRSGHRSAFAAPLMRGEGLKHVLNLDGGVAAWRDAGLPLIAVDE